VRVSTCVLHPAAPTRLLRAAALDVVRHHLVEAGRLSLVVLGFASGRRACLAPAWSGGAGRCCGGCWGGRGGVVCFV